MAVLRRPAFATALLVSAALVTLPVAGPAKAGPDTAAQAAPEAPQPVVAHAHRAIATTVPAAQAAFDRGLVMLYAFNVGEARIAFRAAEKADPTAALTYFGEAIAETIDINRPSTPDGEQRGAAAIAHGGVAAATAAPDDRALFAAAAARFDLKHSQAQRFTDYFHALQSYADAHPADGMASTLAAYAGWNATGALTQGPADDLIPDARVMSADLDRALALDPDDVGAHHLRIHFWEAAHHPERALPDADYLASIDYDPGESHLQHMAGHTYDRVGDYVQMIAVNEAACANDQRYFSEGHGDGQTYMRSYHEHDVDFVLYGLTTLGRNSEARSYASLEPGPSSEEVALRAHADARVLRSLGDAVTPMRVIAEARSGDLDAGRKDLATVTAANPGGTETQLAAAAIARAAGDFPAAIADYRKALALEGGQLGDPKHDWWMPIGEGLGATLLAAHQPAEAERVFRSELVRYPNDPHLEFGLAEALAAQGKDDAVPRAAYRSSWQGTRPLSLADLG